VATVGQEQRELAEGRPGRLPAAIGSFHFHGARHGHMLEGRIRMKSFQAVAWLLVSCTHLQGAHASEASCNASAENNRQIVLAFYDQALVKRQTRAAFERYASEDFVDHKTSLPASTRGAAIDYLEGLIKGLPDPSWEVVRTIAEGDLVVMHNRFTPEANAPAYAIADIFRLRQCKIVEHWDVIGEPVKQQRNPVSRF